MAHAAALLDMDYSISVYLDVLAAERQKVEAEQAQMIRDFIQQGQLPDPLDSAFVQAVNLVLAGLEEVRVSAAELVHALGQGLPQGRDEIAERFNRLLNKLCQGKDIAKVRIIID